MSDSPIAIFGDIHSNLEALEAVLKDMKEIPRRVCLGDVVGYAANPAECLELVQASHCDVLRGNHDEAVFNDRVLADMNNLAQTGMEFSRQNLSVVQKSYLQSLPYSLTKWDCEFVHASLYRPNEWHYILDEFEAQVHFAYQASRIAFSGHTHVPMIWHLEGIKMKGALGQGRVKLPKSGKILINAGSVGQSRDLCPEACYVIFNPLEQWVEFRRVPYDVKKTRLKISRAKLPAYIGQRLELGE